MGRLAGACDYSHDPMLVEALRRGEEAAFAWLVDSYDGSLRRLAFSFVSSRSVADEVVQETWLALIEGIDRFEGRLSLKTWIFWILMNVTRTRGPAGTAACHSRPWPATIRPPPTPNQRFHRSASTHGPDRCTGTGSNPRP
jgi:hypothetical protein